MKSSFLAAATLALVAPVAAHAATTVTFNTTCSATASLTQPQCSGTNGTYGNSTTIQGSDDASLKMLVTAWQANQATGAITTAFLGTYDHGLGVTGVNDQNGANNLHQFDNVNGYTDFVLLQFSRAVHLESASLYLFQLNGVSGMDSDASTYNALTPLTSWNQALDLSVYNNSVIAWNNNAAGTGTAGSRPLNATPGFSQVWLIGASMLTTDRDDGFKISQLTVTAVPSVPEPATWGMMILGFGAIGATLRRRRAANGVLTA